MTLSWYRSIRLRGALKSEMQSLKELTAQFQPKRITHDQDSIVGISYSAEP
jgi:hypothetical protein